MYTSTPTPDTDDIISAPPVVVTVQYVYVLSGCGPDCGWSQVVAASDISDLLHGEEATRADVLRRLTGPYTERV